MCKFPFVCIFQILIVAVNAAATSQLGLSTTNARRLTPCSEEMMNAIAYCSAAEMKTVLSRQPVMVSCMAESQEEPLHIVAQYFCIMPECLEALQVLISMGADPNSKAGDRLLSRTALHLLADRSKPGDCGTGEEQLVKGVQIMMEGGADPNQEDYERRSPLELAQQKGASRNVRKALGDDSPSPSSSSSNTDQLPDESAAKTADTEAEGTETSTADLSIGMIVVAAAAIALALALGIWTLMKYRKSSSQLKATTYSAAGPDTTSTTGFTPASQSVQASKSTVSKSTARSKSLKSQPSSGSNASQEATMSNPAPMIIMQPPPSV
jgi:hypothetical protein